MVHLIQALLLLGSIAYLVAAEPATPSGDDSVQLGLAASYPGDRDLGKDPAVIYATSFEEGITEPLRMNRKGVSIVEDGKLARAGDHCARIVATRGQDEGGDLKILWDEGVEQCFVRVYVRFHADTVMPHHFVNVGGHTPTYKYRWGGAAGLRPPGGADGAFGTTLEPPKGDNGHWKFYTYWHEMHSWQTPQGEADGRPNAYYGNNFDALRPVPVLQRDRWICLEYMVKLNAVGEHDGEQAFWIDGVKYGHWGPGFPLGTWIRESFRSEGKWNTDPKPFPGFNWRTDPALKLNKSSLQWYVSEETLAKATVDENIVYFDNYVIAKEYIGPIAE